MSQRIEKNVIEKNVSRRELIQKAVIVAGAFLLPGCGGGGKGNGTGTGTTGTGTGTAGTGTGGNGGSGSAVSGMIRSARDLDTTTTVHGPAPDGPAPGSKPEPNKTLVQSSVTNTVKKDVFVVCSTQDWTASDVHTLAELVALNPNNDVIYAGALIQGKSLESGLAAPINLPRSGGSVRIEQVNLPANSSYSKHLDVIDGKAILQARQDILAQGVQGTAASLSWQYEAVDSLEKFGLDINADFRYGLGSAKAKFGFNQETKKNYVIAKFIQTYYSLIFEPPTGSPAAVFQDGENTDLRGLITPDNPPLYVSAVNYGRMAFLIMESDYLSHEMTASLEASYKGIDVGGSINADSTYEDVLKKSKVVYVAYGGDAGLAAQPIAGSPTDMADNIRQKYIGASEAARYSASSPGYPISFTLRYLKDSSPAKMSYTVNYIKKTDCTYQTTTSIPTLTGAKFSSHTTDEGKDHDTGVFVEVTTADKSKKIAHADDQDDTGGDNTTYNKNSDHEFDLPLDLSGISKSDCERFNVKVWQKTHGGQGHDTWRFNCRVTLTFSDASTLVATKDNVELKSGRESDTPTVEFQAAA